jgi:hypothetical protein
MRTSPNGSLTLARVYLSLAVAGYLVPGVVMVRESIYSGNILFWTKPGRTTSELFANPTSTAFALDLIGVVVVALLWMTVEARRVGLRSVWAYWVSTWVFGLSGTLPLFLYNRERRLGAAPPAGDPSLR